MQPMALRCPLCNVRISRLPWALTERGESRIRCPRCDSDLLVLRRWHYPVVVIVTCMLAGSGAAAAMELASPPLRSLLTHPHLWPLRSLVYIAAMLAAIVTSYWIMRYGVTLLEAGNHCRNCGYDLRGLLHGVCPECGRRNAHAK